MQRLLGGALGTEKQKSSSVLFTFEIMNRLRYLLIGILFYSISGKAYEQQNGLEYIINTNSISHVPYEAVLYKCVNDVEVVNIPAKITVKYKIWTGGNNYSNEQVTVPVKLYNTNLGAESYQPFYHCKKVKRINIAAGINTIVGAIFNGCASLEQVNVNEANENYMSKDGILYDKNQTTIVRIPPSCKTLPTLSNISTIGDYAYAQCPIEELSIPASVLNIGKGAFVECAKLKKVYTASLSSWLSIKFGDTNANPLYLAHHLYLSSGHQGNEEITDITIPQQIRTIESFSFAGALFKSVSFHENISRIGEYIFDGGVIDSIYCAKNKDIYIYRSFDRSEINKAEIHSINYLGSEYLGCVKECYVGEDITELPTWAFRGFGGTVILHDNINAIGNYAFKESVKNVLVKPGTISLLNLLNNKYEEEAIYSIIDVNTKEEIMAPALKLLQATQTTLSLSIDNKIDGFSYYSKYRINYSDETTNFMTGDQCLITGCNPENEITFNLYASWGSTEKIIGRFTFKTEGLSPKIKFISKTASAVFIEGSYNKGDAIINSEEVAICTMKTTSSSDRNAYYSQYSHSIASSYYYNNYYLAEETEPVENSRTKIYGLTPSSSYYAIYFVRVGKEEYRVIVPFATPALKLTTDKPKVTNKGEAIVSATTNMDEAETHTGFEWRKTDAPDVVDSRQCEAIIYNGKMEGKIKNLDASVYWKVRAYYKANSGKMYYGDWVGFDPSDFSYFEPSVHTYSSPVVDGNAVMLNGMVVEGSDEIQEQGFEYWKDSVNSRNQTRAPSNVQRVTATGERMTATLTGLAVGTQYGFRAFAKTAKGTFYGEEQTFTTERSSSGEGDDTGTPYTITTSAAGYATFYDSKSAYTLPSELTAQVVTDFANNKLVYETIGSTVPKGVAVMLMSNNKRAASYTMSPTSSSATYASTNLLHGSDAATTTSGSGYHYKLSFGKSGSSQSSVFGWYWGNQNGGAFQIDGHKAWLVLPKSANTRSFSIDGEATGIVNVDNVNSETVYYDLQGRRINSPVAKGVYIVNGKKITIK